MGICCRNLSLIQNSKNSIFHTHVVHNLNFLNINCDVTFLSPKCINFKRHDYDNMLLAVFQNKGEANWKL